jgi:DNA processing protein
MDDLSYWLALQTAPGIGPGTLFKLFRQIPQPQLIFDSPEMVNTLAIPSTQKKSLEYAIQSPDWARVEQILEWAEQPDNYIVLLNHDKYPELLRQIHKPPVLLYIKGQLDILNQTQLAMVGSRNPSVDGSETAKQFAYHLAANGMVITSGMALGIDAQSHRGALNAKGNSIAVAGTGLDRIYPARHKELAWKLIEQGAIISEYPLGVGPMKANFPQRNRIISGMSVGTLVVEAALQSGSLITAYEALEQGREVFAIPGSIHNPLSRGCHQLIKNGAKLVETADDILEELSSLILASRISSTTDEVKSDPSVNQAIDPLLPKVQQLILKNIGFTPISIDLIIERTGLSAAEVQANLVLLEIDQYIQTHPGNLYALSH